MRVARRIVVTGATGCVGRAVVDEALERGWSVLGCARRRVEDWPDRAIFKSADVTDATGFMAVAQNAEAVVHLAGEVHDPSASLDDLRASLVEGTRVVATASQQIGARLLVVSSAAVYGRAAAKIDIRTPVEPDTAYGTAKLESERVAMSAHDSPMIVRPTVVYGRYDRGNMRRLIRAVSRFGPIVVGTGDNRKSIVYAPHLAARIVGLLESNVTSGVWCASDQIAPTQSELVVLLARALKRGSRARHIPAGITLAAVRALDFALRTRSWRMRIERLLASSVVDGQPLDSLLGFQERLPLERALEETTSWVLAEQRLSN